MPLKRKFEKSSISTSAFALVLSFALLTGACSREPVIKKPRSISIATIGEPKRLLPMLASDSASGEISGLVFNGLVKYAPNITLIGDLAKSWTISPDGLSVTFHLRKGVKWHDGEDFSAHDVVFTYNVVTDPKTPTPYGANYGPVKSVEALDDHTVLVTYTELFAPALESWSMGIVPRHLLEGKDIGKSDLNRNPIGTGPYKLKEWATGQKVVLEANKDYFEGPPGVDRYVMRIIPDTATQFLELKFGGIDFMGLTPTQYKLESDKPIFKKYFQKFRYPAFGFTYMGYNHLDPRFKDKRIRRALTHAIDKEEIIKGVLLGYGTPCTGPFPPESWAFNADVKDPEYNPEKALALLKEAGWERDADGILRKDGEAFNFTVLTNQGNDQRLKAAQIIRERLKAVGITMEIKVLEWQAFLHKFVNKKRFEAIILGWGLSRDPDLYDIWHSSKTKEGEFNFISYKNEEVDQLLLDGRSTFDIEERRRIYHRIHELMAEDQPYTFLYVADALPILHKRFKGVEKAPIGIFYDFINWHIPADKTTWYQ